MADIAQLGYAVDSSELTKGTAALDKHTAAAARTDTATAKFEKQSTKLALSQKQLVAAQRQLPMQFTDIAVSLQAGQSPMQVLLQQGGQLKDVFGGIGPAARGMAGYIAGLINPFTLAAAAVAGLAVAWSQAEEQQNAIDRALIRTGKYTQEYAEDLSALAREMDSIAGVTAGSASRAIAEVAGAGNFTKDQLETVARAAETWRASTGDAIEDTVKSFAKLRGEPVKAALELNKSYGFLTESVLAQIIALEDQGREVEASDLLINELANTLERRAPQMADQVGMLAKAWRGFSNIVSESWDAVISGVDRYGPAVLRAMKYLPGTGFAARAVEMAVDRGGGSGSGKPSFANVSTSPIVDSEAVERQRKAEEKWDRLALSNLSKEQKLEQEIADIRKAGGIAKKTEAEIETQIANARARYAESAAKGRKATATDPTDALVKRLQDQIALNQEQIAQEEKLTATERILVQVRTDLERIGAKGSETNKALIAQLMQQAKATDEAAKAADRKRVADEALARLQERTMLAEQNQRRGNEVDLIGMGRGSDATEMLRRQLDLHRWYEDQVVELGRQAAREKRAVTLAEEEELKGSLQRMLDEERRYQEQRLALMGDWRAGASRALEDYVAFASDLNGQAYEMLGSGISSLEDEIVGLTKTGKFEWEGMLESWAEMATRFATRQIFSQLIEKFFPDLGGDDQAAALSKSAGELAASGATLIAAASALGASAAALAAAGVGAAATSGGQSATGAMAGGGGWAGLIGSVIGSFAGGRAFGGGVRDGSFYRTGEGNRPELLNMGRGRQYLIPGDSGRVEPITGGGGMTVGPTTNNFYTQTRNTADTARQVSIRQAQRQRLATARFGG